LLLRNQIKTLHGPAKGIWIAPDKKVGFKEE
jgi:hypothetical protein